MAKKKDSRSRTPRKAPRPPSATHLKKDVEKLDRKLISLINERVEAACRAAEAKPKSADTYPDFTEDRQCLERVTDANPGPLSTEALKAIFRELLSGTRSLLATTKVVYLGPMYSYSHLAAVEQFGSSTELVPVATIAAVFDAVTRRQADFGLVPIENSTDGRITDTLDMFARSPSRICGEVQLRVHHFLLGKCRRTEVREVFSKPQALSQCRTWLSRHLPDAHSVETASTAEAAKLAAEKPGAAAIASRQAGLNYGLDVLAAEIEDNRHNVTRFAVIGDRVSGRTGDDKTSVMFELPHEPGALADAMAIFKRNRLNLTWIESFPMPETPNEYLFFVELQGHPDEIRTRRALAALRRKTVRLEILGSYPATAPIV